MKRKLPLLICGALLLAACGEAPDLAPAPEAPPAPERVAAQIALDLVDPARQKNYRGR